MTLALGLLIAASVASAAPAPKKIKAALGREFTLLKGQSAALGNTDAEIRVTGFVNSPCPKGARCVWSGLRVNLELSVAGATVPLNGSAPYRVEILSSDYTTRAALRASKNPAP